jgi:Domain of unknown function (DUF5597)
LSRFGLLLSDYGCDHRPAVGCCPKRSQIISAEQGIYENDFWKPLRLWNGDETDRGLCFHEKPEVVRVHLGRF